MRSDRGVEAAKRAQSVTIVAHDIGGPGGMECVLAELIGGLLARGREVCVISRTCQVPANDRLFWYRVPGPARPFPLAYPWFLLFGSLITWRRRAGAVLSTGAIIVNRVDWCAVHFCHHATRDLGLSRTSRRTRTHRVNAKMAELLSRAGERMIYRPSRVGGLVGVSGGVSAELSELFPGMRCETVPNGVNNERFAPDPSARQVTRQRYGLASDDLVAVFVGSEWERKGLRPAIEALAAASGWKLLVVGHGDVEAYRAVAGAVGVEDRVVFTGGQDDPAPFYSAGDAFVLPSRYETFSLVSYEAAAAGLPVLASAVNGVTDLLHDGESGWFVISSATDIARRLNELGNRPGLAEEMGHVGRATAARFTWRRMVEAYLHLLEPAEGAQ